MQARTKKWLGLVIVALTLFFLTRAVKDARLNYAKASFVGEQGKQHVGRTELGGSHTLNTTPAANIPFFDRKPRSQIIAERNAKQTNSPVADRNWFKNGQNSATPVTNEFTVGRRTATIVSTKPVDVDAVYEFLTAQAEMDKITDTRLAELKAATAHLKSGMLANEVVRVLGGEPTRQAQLNGHDFYAYSTHPTKLHPGPGEHFFVLHIEFDENRTLLSWRFKRH